MIEKREQSRCRHLFTDGRQCGSPSLRQEELCYNHHTARLPAATPRRRSLAVSEEFDLPMPEDRPAVQRALGEVLRRIAADQIDLKRAGMLLYGLALASSNLPREAATPAPATPGQPEAPVIDVVMDPELGPLAPANHRPLTKGQCRTSPAAFRRTQERAIEQATLAEFDAILARIPTPKPQPTPIAIPPSPFDHPSHAQTPATDTLTSEARDDQADQATATLAQLLALYPPEKS